MIEGQAGKPQRSCLPVMVLAGLLFLGPVGARAQSVPAWQTNHPYALGDLANYKGVTYQALRPMTSSPVQTPAAMPGLWQVINLKAAGQCAAVPLPPTGLTSSNLTSTGVTIAWKAPAPPKNCSLGSYTVLKNGAAIATTSNKNLAVTGLSPGTSYSFTVTARDFFGPSKASAILKVKTLAKSGSGSSCAAAWSASAVYLAGATASVAGVNHKANWWTQGNNPTTSSGPAGSGQPWTAAGACAPCSAPPGAPTGLTAFGTTNSSTSLLWQPSVVPANCKVTSYSLFKNGTQVATTPGTSVTVPQLAANTSYSFTVAGVDPVGTSPKSTAVSVKTLAAPTGGSPPTIYAPYIDMALGQDQNLVAVSKASGIKVFTLAFVLSSGGCAAGWQGVGSIAQGTLDNGTTMLSQVQALRAAGGDVIISFGGAAGQEPALTCPDAASLKAVYQQVVDRYQAKSLDFDIEGGAVADQPSIARRNKALVALKAANPGLKISFTLPVLPTGLDSSGVGVLQSAKRDGLNPDVINVMTMDYGASVDNGGRMGSDATAATSNTAVQVHQRFVAIVLAAMVMLLIIVAMVDPRLQIGIRIDLASLR